MKQHKEQVVSLEQVKDELKTTKREFRKRLTIIRAKIASSAIGDLKSLIDK